MLNQNLKLEALEEKSESRTSPSGARTGVDHWEEAQTTHTNLEKGEKDRVLLKVEEADLAQIESRLCRRKTLRKARRPESC